MLLTQLLSASTLAVPVWAQNTYTSSSDPQQSVQHGNLDYIKADLQQQQQHRLQNAYSQQSIDSSLGSDPSESNLFPYHRHQPQLLHREHQVEEYTKVVNSNAYIIHGNDVPRDGASDSDRLPINTHHGDARSTIDVIPGSGRGAAGQGPTQVAMSSAQLPGSRKSSPSASPTIDGPSIGKQQRTGAAHEPTIVKNWQKSSQGLQTKSLTRNNVQESFNRNYFISGAAAAGARPVSTGLPPGVPDLAIRTVTKNVTNVLSEHVLYGAAAHRDHRPASGVRSWPQQQQQQQQGWHFAGADIDGFRGADATGSVDSKYRSGAVGSGVGGGSEAGANGDLSEVDRPTNRVRVNNGRNAYPFSEGGGAINGQVTKSVSHINNASSGASVDGNAVKSNYRNSVESNSVRLPLNTNNRESVRINKNNNNHQEGRGASAKPAVAGLGGIAGAAGVDGVGKSGADLWNNYGYKVALLTAAGLIAILAVLGVVRCLRSSSATGNGGGGIAGTSVRGNSRNHSRGIRGAGLALSASLLSEDQTPLNAGSPHSVPMLSVQSPGYAGMERLGVPARSSIANSSPSTSPPVGLQQHHGNNLDEVDDDDASSSGTRITRNSQLTASGRKVVRMAPQRDCLVPCGAAQKMAQQQQQIIGHCNSHIGGARRCNSGNCDNVGSGCNRNGSGLPSCGNSKAVDTSMAESSAGSDVKLYVALESSGSSSSTGSSLPMPVRSHYNNNQGYRELGGDPGDMNNGRCPHHVKLGDSEWGPADRPVNQIRVPYQAELTRTYIKPPPNKTALDVPDRDRDSSAAAAASVAMMMPSRNSSSNLLNFPYAHGMSASQEALSTTTSSSGGAGSKAPKQSNFPFSRFFKGRGSSSSINNSHNGRDTAKSRPESPNRYAGNSKSTSAMDSKQRLSTSTLPMSGSSISLASTVYANSTHVEQRGGVVAAAGGSSGGGLTNHSYGDPAAVLVDVTQSTNYCVYVTASVDASSASSSERYRSSSTTTTTTTTVQCGGGSPHPPPCDTNREFDLTAAAASVSSNRHNNLSNHHSMGGGGGRGYGNVSDVHSINSNHPPQQQQQLHHQQQHQKQMPMTVSNSPAPKQQPIMPGAAGLAGADATPASSCDKRVYVEKRIKTSDTEAVVGGGKSGFKGLDMDTDPSV